MATELGLLSLTHLHKLTQSQATPNNHNQNQSKNNQNQHHQDSQLNPNTTLSTNPTPTTTTTTIALTTSTNIDTTSPSWMWNPKGNQDADEDSWEVRAFAEDTGNVMGTTWPPRSYTCAFCRREFRSAQALGGHMNVHRRDRARLHQVIPPSSLISHPSVASASPSVASSSFLIPTREFIASGSGLCLLYQYPNPNNSTANNFTACTTESASTPSPSTLLSISPGSMVGPLNYPAGGDASSWSRQIRQQEGKESAGNGGDAELDLELRLGHGPTPS